MSGSDRNTEIWSTRLQRELLAMTAGGGGAEGDKSDESSKDEAPAAVLPPFCKVTDHQLDIERGDCTVMCWIDLPPSSTSPAAVDAVNQTTKVTAQVDEGTEEKTEEKADGAEPSKEEGDAGEEKKTTSESDVATTTTAASSISEEAAPIIITLDMSLQKKPDGSINTMAVSYPFMKPVAILTSGCDRFPTGSTIKDGNTIAIEMDWTPSLHLTDALLNIALKVKECLSQNEPFHSDFDNTSADTMSEMMNRAKKLGASVTESIRGLTEEKPEKKKGFSALIGLGGKKKKDKKQKEKPKQEPKPKPVTEARMGAEINMLEAPWVDCRGVYSCKSIRRPKFVATAVAAVEKKQKEKEAAEQQKAASAGLAGAGAMFKTFTKSARNVLEESFLMITDTHIIELRSNKLNLSTGTITFAIPIEKLAKLKFRRQESISLFFKPAPDDPLIYMCPDSADCVHQIQAVLKRHGVKGKHTNAATHRAINQALHLVQEIQTKELALKHDPSVERVNEIMDLYRQAAERFEVAGDPRHEEVVTHMRKFLALPLTTSILDGTYTKPPTDEPIATSTGEGIVLTSPTKVADKEGDDDAAKEEGEDQDFHNNVDNLLKEAEADLANMSVEIEEDPELEAMLEEGAGGGDADDAIADFENMLKEADNELAELMNS